MKKIIILALVLFPVMGVYAQSETQPTPTRQNILRERIEKQKTNYIQNLQEAREIGEQYREAKSPEERDELREKARESFNLRLTNAIERLTLMQDQTEERLLLMKSRGIDITDAQEKLSTSREYLSVTNATYEEIQTKLKAQTINKEEVQMLFETMKENFSLARQSLIEVLAILKEKAIDSLQVSNKEDVSTSDISIKQQ